MDQNAYIDQAAAHFRTLLTEQLNRQERMAQGSPAKDFSRMERIVIGLIPGDGIGPILMAQARRHLSLIRCPLLAVQSHGDQTISADSLDIIMQGVSSPVRASLWLESAPHVCTISPEYGKIVDAMDEFLRRAEQGEDNK